MLYQVAFDSALIADLFVPAVWAQLVIWREVFHILKRINQAR